MHKTVFTTKLLNRIKIPSVRRLKQYGLLKKLVVKQQRRLSFQQAASLFTFVAMHLPLYLSCIFYLVYLILYPMGTTGKIKYASASCSGQASCTVWKGTSGQLFFLHLFCKLFKAALIDLFDSSA